MLHLLPASHDFGNRLEAEFRADNVTRLQRDYGRLLAAAMDLGETPSVPEIARALGCNARSVQRARARLETLGLLETEAQYETRNGVRWQCRNRYTLRAPTGPILPRQRKRPTVRGDILPGQIRQKISKEAATVALATVLAHREAALAQRWSERYGANRP